MKKNKELKRIAFDIDKKIKAKTSYHCQMNDISLKDFVTKLITDFFEKVKIK